MACVMTELPEGHKCSALMYLMNPNLLLTLST